MANALDELGIVRRLTGDYPGAAQAQQEALDIYRDLGDRQGQANALDHLGTLRTLTDDYDRPSRPWMWRWPFSANSATARARPTPSLTWERFPGLPGITGPRCCARRRR